MIIQYEGLSSNLLGDFRDGFLTAISNQYHFGARNYKTGDGSLNMGNFSNACTGLSPETCATFGQQIGWLQDMEFFYSDSKPFAVQVTDGIWKQALSIAKEVIRGVYPKDSRMKNLWTWGNAYEGSIIYKYGLNKSLGLYDPTVNDQMNTVFNRSLRVENENGEPILDSNGEFTYHKVGIPSFLQYIEGNGNVFQLLTSGQNLAMTGDGHELSQKEVKGW